VQQIVNSIDITRLISKDETFGRIRKRYGDPPYWQREKGFISLCRIILEQQVSLESANAHFVKLNKYIGKLSPTKILKLTDEEMRDCQISRQKATYLRALATAVKTKMLVFEELEVKNEEEIREILLSIKGIGNWTTDIYLMFCMQFKDIIPWGDIAVISTVKELYGIEQKELIIRLSEKWKPYRSLAAYYFWHYYLSSRNRVHRQDA